MAIKEVALTLDLPYRFRQRQLEEIGAAEGLDGDKPGMQDISTFLIKTAVNNLQKWANGVSSTDRRMWGEIQDLLFSRPTALTLNGTQFRWLHDSVEKYEFRPALSSWSCVLLDEFERAKKGAEADGQPEAKEC